MLWITADHHFGHKNIIEYEDRPFRPWPDDACVEDMDLEMIRRWNRVVAPDDIVYHLGDFALDTKDRIRWLVEHLNGKIILILGNHDRHSKSFYGEVFYEVHKGPIVLYSDDPQWSLLILDHRRRLKIHSLNVAVENWDYYPIPMPRPKGILMVHGHSHRNYIVSVGGY